MNTTISLVERSNAAQNQIVRELQTRDMTETTGQAIGEEELRFEVERQNILEQPPQHLADVLRDPIESSSSSEETATFSPQVQPITDFVQLRSETQLLRQEIEKLVKLQVSRVSSQASGASHQRTEGRPTCIVCGLTFRATVRIPLAYACLHQVCKECYDQPEFKPWLKKCPTCKVVQKEGPKLNFGYHEHLLADSILESTPKITITLKKSRKRNQAAKIRQRKARKIKKREASKNT